MIDELIKCSINLNLFNIIYYAIMFCLTTIIYNKFYKQKPYKIRNTQFKSTYIVLIILRLYTKHFHQMYLNIISCHDRFVFKIYLYNIHSRINKWSNV